MKQFSLLNILSVLFMLSLTACTDDVIDSYASEDEVYKRIVVTAEDLKLEDGSRTNFTIT